MEQKEQLDHRGYYYYFLDFGDFLDFKMYISDNVTSDMEMKILYQKVYNQIANGITKKNSKNKEYQSLRKEIL